MHEQARYLSAHYNRPSRQPLTQIKSICRHTDCRGADELWLDPGPGWRHFLQRVLASFSHHYDGAVLAPHPHSVVVILAMSLNDLINATLASLLDSSLSPRECSLLADLREATFSMP